MMTPHEAMLSLALTKYMAKHVKDKEAELKTYLEDQIMAPGTTLRAQLEGEEIAVISRSKPETYYTVTDPVAFAKWQEENGLPVTWLQVPHERHITKDMAKKCVERLQAESPGELPDGVDTVQAKPSTRVTVTSKQMEFIAEHAQAVRSTLAGLTQIEGADNE